MTSWSKKKFDRQKVNNPYAKSLRSPHLKQQILSKEEKVDKKKLMEAINEED